jgi:hypothetical protein
MCGNDTKSALFCGSRIPNSACMLYVVPFLPLKLQRLSTHSRVGLLCLVWCCYGYRREGATSRTRWCDECRGNSRPSIILLRLIAHGRTALEAFQRNRILLTEIDMLCRDNKAGVLYPLQAGLLHAFKDTWRSQDESEPGVSPYSRQSFLHDIFWRSSRTSAFPGHPFDPRFFVFHR